ncbi:MAG: hypothetical protein OQJ89_13150 [Kangiellaceae bacterium]|nr:hypothetical protein [Kangiellaceae bacterium]MCW9017911.1 hypothetical protein [Kangiellaceae bacterium]
MFKKILILWLVLVPSILLVLNYKSITNPSEELIKTLNAENVPMWKVDFLLWNGADISYKEGSSYEAMLAFKHYELIDIFGEHVTASKKEQIYSITKKYKLTNEIDERIKVSLNMNKAAQ